MFKFGSYNLTIWLIEIIYEAYRRSYSRLDKYVEILKGVKNISIGMKPFRETKNKARRVFAQSG